MGRLDVPQLEHFLEIEQRVDERHSCEWRLAASRPLNTDLTAVRIVSIRAERESCKVALQKWQILGKHERRTVRRYIRDLDVDGPTSNEDLRGDFDRSEVRGAKALRSKMHGPPLSTFKLLVFVRSIDLRVAHWQPPLSVRIGDSDCMSCATVGERVDDRSSDIQPRHNFALPSRRGLMPCRPDGARMARRH